MKTKPVKPLTGWWRWRAEKWDGMITQGLTFAEIAHKEQMAVRTIERNLTRFWTLETGVE